MRRTLYTPSVLCVWLLGEEGGVDILRLTYWVIQWSVAWTRGWTRVDVVDVLDVTGYCFPCLGGRLTFSNRVKSAVIQLGV